ncbi:hypothetical protein [Anaeromyxobacter oryzae]|uniref:Uncharacterized protein n=1 Tax=Anaeromyxobacter oryzae TaxID=2918170 RepID=A0ABM7X077_9BACT|nr:hypothetical protein [Anaeromyxobacter oryzae]BDG05190.1 hypothetical protein AMOR_41860 [Anaeromyxobacter oryzae]
MMPPTWMIEELKRRRREREEAEQPRPFLEIPAPERMPRNQTEPDRPRRSVIVIDL